MNMKRKISSPNVRESGTIFLVMSGLLLAILVFVALVIDIGRAQLTQRKLKTAADASSYSTVRHLASADVTSEELMTFATNIADENKLTSEELNNGPNTGIFFGKWEDEALDTEVPFSEVNAVRVAARRSLFTFLANVVGVSSLMPYARSTALLTGAGSANCVVPFGIILELVTDAEFGDVFTISRESSGNWGKIDIGGNMSNGNNFYELFLSGNCDQEVEVGEEYDPAPGFSGISDAFRDRMNSNPEVPMVVVEEFPQGGSTQIEILGFVMLEILSTSGSGKNWEATLKFLRRIVGSDPGGPSDPPFGLSAVFVE